MSNVMQNDDISILIIDDLSDNRILLRLDLEDELEGIRVDEASNGKEALKLIKENEYSVILCDLMMPEMDGFEVYMKVIKMGYPNLPFIFVSANQDRTVFVKGLEIGAIDFVTKPYDVIELIHKVKNLSKIKFYCDKQEKLLHQLEVKNQQLRESNLQKDEVLRIVSHDMRNPLGNIIGLASIMLEEPDQTPEDISSMADVVMKSGENLMDIVNTLLDVAKIEAGKVEISKSLIDVKSLIDEACEQFLFSAQKKLITLDHLCELSSVLLKTDPPKFKQIIGNLLSNAIKFTSSKGSITVSTYVEKNDVIIKITDTGIGISDDEQKWIFEKFSAAQKTGTMNEKGTGLGLSIVKSFVELLNGTIEVTSKVNKGSTFTLRFPKE